MKVRAFLWKKERITVWTFSKDYTLGITRAETARIKATTKEKITIWNFSKGYILGITRSATVRIKTTTGFNYSDFFK